jgi:acyl-CoA thioester hydrolase
VSVPATATLETLRARVGPDWVDSHGHLNVAYYGMIFERAVERFLDLLGLGEATTRKGLGSMVAVEDDVIPRRELNAEDGVRVTLQLLDFDDRKMHYFLRMFHEDEGFLAATNERVSSYVDFQTRSSAPMPAGARAKLAQIYQTHRELARPKEASRGIGTRPR